MKEIYLTTPLKKLPQLKIYFSLILISLTTLISCKKTTIESSNLVAFSVVNASPTFATYDVYLNDGKLNSVALPFGGSTKYGQYTAGTQNIKFTTSGRSESLLTKSISLTPNIYQTFYLIDRPGSLDGLLVTDDVSANSNDKAFIRFINLSPDAPALDLTVTNGTSLITGKAYKAASPFTTLASGTYSFDLKDGAGSVKATLPNAVLTAGKYYTIISRGLINPANSLEHPLSIQVILHQ
ncbi:DUF4397 domain-containing protein [Pedobacter sp. UC225_61]|uniref:DUF4397 domain-containing protein n=1 Tax=Pedobacter sp. UC225_61 TaxID=3374623 RepID=UPI0037ACDE1E